VTSPLPALADWATFYVILGSAAAALTGLQFVVITLVLQRDDVPRSQATLEAFGSPTIVHFCGALLIAAILSCPWHRASSLALALLLAGAAGIGYTAIVTWRAFRQTGYAPVMEDWVWHSVLPLGGYVALTGAAFAAGSGGWSLFVVAGVTVLLIFIGIHNAWDTVAYLAVRPSREWHARPGDTAPRTEPKADPPEVRVEARAPSPPPLPPAP
jgi:hypothetical protein